MLRDTDNIPHNIMGISHVQTECGKYPRTLCEIQSIPQNIVKDPNNGMRT